MNEPAAERHALKEWASVIAAVSAGDQVVLLRKGGLAERSFGVKAPSFLFFPTFLHQTENQFHPRFAHHLDASLAGADQAEDMTLTTWCQVVESFEVRELDRLLALKEDLIFTEATVRERFAFRPDQAVSVIALRAWQLETPRSVPNLKRYGGCRSWLELEDSFDLGVRHQAVEEESLQQRIGAIAAVLGGSLRTERATQ